MNLTSCFGTMWGKTENLDGDSTTSSSVVGTNAKYLQSIPVSEETPQDPSQVLKFNGSTWGPQFIFLSDLKSSISGESVFPSANCASNQSLNYNSIVDKFECQNISISLGAININSLLPTQASNAGKFLVTDGSQVYWSSVNITIATSPWITSGSNIYYLGGFVGLGTSSPASALDINGQLSIQGLNAIRFPTSETQLGNSIAIGPNALNSQITSGSYNNLAIGKNALSSGTLDVTAYNNIAIGNDTLKYNTTGYENVAIGGPGEFGYSAMSMNTTGNRSVAIGAGANGQNTTGWGNTAIGYLAMGKNQVGTQNTLIGESAGLNGITTDFNSCVGASCLKNNISGYNSAIGINALMNSTTAFYNVAIGSNAGTALTTGDTNTIVGADVGSTTLSTGGNNILIGTNSSVDTPLSSTSNFINIGNIIFVTAATGTLAVPSGNVGLGVVAPSERLDLGGGNISMGYEIITNNCGNVSSCTATCSAGKQVLGGGGSCVGSTIAISSTQSSSNNGWVVELASSCNTGTFNSYAICANIK